MSGADGSRGHTGIANRFAGSRRSCHACSKIRIDVKCARNRARGRRRRTSRSTLTPILRMRPTLPIRRQGVLPGNARTADRWATSRQTKGSSTDVVHPRSWASPKIPGSRGLRGPAHEAGAVAVTVLPSARAETQLLVDSPASVSSPSFNRPRLGVSQVQNLLTCWA